MLISTPLINVRTDYQCDNCKTGVLLPVAQVPKLSVASTTQSPPIESYLHTCQHCQAEKALDKRYPLFESIKYFDLLKTIQEHSSNGR